MFSNVLKFAAPLGAWFFMLVLAACTKDKTDPPSLTYTGGFWVVNEGPFGSGTGTLTWISRNGDRVEQDVFGRVNQRPLGNIAQSMQGNGSLGIIAVNNAGKLEWVNLQTMTSEGTLQGLALPSTIAVDAVRGKAYVSEWVSFGGNGRIAVIDLNSRQKIREIPVGPFPDALMLSGSQLWVANGDSNFVSVVDVNADTILKQLVVGDRPNSLALWQNNVAVLCGGRPSWAGVETGGSLHLLASNTLNVIQSQIFPLANQHPKDLLLTPAGDALIYQLEAGNYSGLHRLDLPLAPGPINPGTPLIPRVFYHIAFDPHGSRSLVATDAGNFAQAGKCYRYSNQWSLVDSFATGIGPGHLYFVP
jgi:YVTN family beta-propeller protein